MIEHRGEETGWGWGEGSLDDTRAASSATIIRMNTITSIRQILLRDIDRLRVEIEAFEHEADLWRAVPGTTNPPGALALHLCGNLQHFIGATLGSTGYVRDRDAEFAARDVPRASVLAAIAKARSVVERALGELDEAEVAREYPARFLDELPTTGAVLVHLSGHLMYHLGQINYARRFHAAPAPSPRFVT